MASREKYEKKNINFYILLTNINTKLNLNKITYFCYFLMQNLLVTHNFIMIILSISKKKVTLDSCSGHSF